MEPIIFNIVNIINVFHIFLSIFNMYLTAIFIFNKKMSR